MKRKKSETPSRIWTYGCLPAVVNAELAHAELRKSHRYYNALIEIERSRRAKYRAARRELCPELAEQEEIIERTSAAIEEGEGDFEKLSAERKVAGARAKELRKTSRSLVELSEASDRINAEALARVRAARESEDAPFWGSYLLVEKAVESAKKSKADPKFKRWRGEGRLGVQLQTTRGNRSIEDVLLGKNTSIRIEPAGQSRGGRRKFVRVSLRVGSDGRRPVWATFPCVWHREPPAGATITWAWVKFTRIGPRLRLQLQLTLESEKFEQPAVTGLGRVAAIDLGWRKLGGHRVAYLFDDLGNHGEFKLPEEIDSALVHCYELSAIRDRAFDQVRAKFASIADELPDWVKQEAKYIGKWKSPAKLASIAHRLVAEWGDLGALWKEWRAERAQSGLDYHAPWDEVAEWARARGAPEHLVCLDWWRRQNHHLYSWIESQRSRALGRRDDLFAQWACWIGKNYESVAIEKFDLRPFNRRLSKEYENMPVKVATELRRQRNTCAPGTFRLALISALGKHRVVEVLTKNSTRECAHCGHVNTWPDQSRLKLTCAGCKRRWDQDENAARVLLSRFERPGDGEGGGGPREGDKDAGELAAE